jgi:glycine cleavage system H protein
MPTPTDRKYTKEHEWAKQDGDVIIVGITDYAQHALGDVVYVELPAVGKSVTAMQTFGVVESVKAASDLFAPVSGSVTAANTALQDQPELVNSAPYGDGWMLKVKPSNMGELDALLSAEQYDAFIATL